MERLLRWLVLLTLLAAFLAVHTDAVKATSLIFGKTSTTSTEAPLDEEPSASGDETGTEKSENNTSTKPALTGIPQIDYIWDPNLPRELNGYNLSNYPFLNSVPDLEDIDFKCDGLHDGFYASVKYDCQLYHHCLFGIRYDFLCANFTAFDQKTFICHFVSEVDCKNSPKYFHRNDALYEAATTTTQKPSTTTTTTTTTAAPPPAVAPAARPRPGRPYRRPYRRRRPQLDYYYEDEEYDDDYYEERINRRRKQRPRPRRPEYDDYEEGDRYEPRPAYNSDRSRGKMEDDDYEYDRRFERPRYRPRHEDNRRPYDDRRGYTDRRNPDEGRYRPQQERRYHDEDRRPASDRRKPPQSDRRPNEPVKQSRHQEDEEKVIKRPIQEEPAKTVEEPTKIRPSGSGGSNPLLFAPRTPPKIRRPVPINEREKYEYSTTTSTKAPEIEPQQEEYYDDEYEDEAPVETLPPAKAPKEEATEKPRLPPQIPEKFENRRPQEREPTNPPPRRPQEYEYYGDEYDERPKSTFKKPGVVLRTSTTTPAPPPALPARTTPKAPETESEEEERPKFTSDRFSSRIPSSGSFSFGTARLRQKEEAPEQIETPFRSTQRPQVPSIGRDVEGIPEEPQYRQVSREKYPPPQEDLEDAYEEKPRNPPPQIPIQEDAAQREVVRPVVRVVKRPFLPSRGGNPVLPRGLQPVGINSKEVVTESSVPVDLGSTVSGVRMLEHSPPILRFPQEYNQPPQIVPQKFTYSGPRTTQAPQVDVPKSTLEEIYNSDYDVTLNDALNPTLKPIAPSRAPSSLGYSISAPAKLLERSRYSLPYTAAGDVHYSSSQLRPAVHLPPAIRRQAPPYSDPRPHVPLYELDY